MTARSTIITVVLVSIAAVISFGNVRPAAAQGQPIIMMGPCGNYGHHPVCARGKGKLATFVNACAARSAGARIVSQGECPVACPMIFDPVCAVGPDGKRKTYGNECQARAAGATDLRNRRCLPRLR